MIELLAIECANCAFSALSTGGVFIVGSIAS